jgi:hypothetical protein
MNQFQILMKLGMNIMTLEVTLILYIYTLLLIFKYGDAAKLKCMQHYSGTVKLRR